MKNDLSDVESALFDNGTNAFDPDIEWINGNFVNGKVVELSTGLGMAVTMGFTPVTGGDTWVISWKAIEPICTMYVLGYEGDDEDTWIDSYSETIQMTSVKRYGTFTPPLNCSFVRFRIYRSGADWQTIVPDEIQVELGTTPTEYQRGGKVSKINAITKDIDDIRTEIENIDVDVETDETLTLDGVAANSKTVGDKFKTVDSDIDSLIQDIYTTNESKNVFPNSPVWKNGTFSNGNLIELTTGTNNAALEDYISVTPEESWVISWKAIEPTCVMYIMAYQSDKTWIDSFNETIQMTSVKRFGTFTTPSNCVYIRLRIYRNGANWQTIVPDEIQVELGTTPTEYEPKSDKISRLNIAEEKLEIIEDELKTFSARDVLSNSNLLDDPKSGYLDNDGIFHPDSNGWFISDYISVKPGDFVYFYNINNFNFFGYFNEGKEWLGGKNIETPTVTDAGKLCIHKVPNNAAYIIVSWEDTKADSCWGNYIPVVPNGEIIKANTHLLRSYEYFPTNPCDYAGMDTCAFRKGLCIGDSLTGGGFNYNSGTSPWSDGNVYSYPSQFQKMTGVQMVNEGHSGKTTVQWWSLYGTGGQSQIDFSGYDFAIIHLGVNDVSYSVPIEDTRTAYQSIIDALKTANTGIKIFVCTIIPAYADAVIVESSYGSVNTMISNFAEQENVYLCDLTRYAHIYTNSQYAAGHLTAYGYWRMAKDLISYIGYIMQKYPNEFRFIHFIGTDMEY